MSFPKSAAAAIKGQIRLPATAIVLMTVAGFVDAVGYVLLAHVFVANMSGNSVAVGLGAAGGRWSSLFHRGYPIATFVLGLLIGGLVAEIMKRRGIIRALGWTLLLETVLLGAFLVAGGMLLGWHARGPTGNLVCEVILVGLAATAMGVQNVSLRASGAMSFYTTHVTGALTQLADDAVQYGLWIHRRSRAGSPNRLRRWRRIFKASVRQSSFRELVFLGIAWILYVWGAVAGGLSLTRWGLIAVVLPLLAVGVVTGIELGCAKMERPC